MPILASLLPLNLFTSLPSTPPPNDSSLPSTSYRLPIQIPKYPLPRSRRLVNHQNAPPKESPAFRLPHRRTKFFKPVKKGDVLSVDGEDNRAVVIGDTGVSYLLPDAPFEYQYSYSEVPNAKPLAIREPAHLPFSPPSMPRPWTGKPPLKKKKDKKKIALLDSFNPPPLGKKGVKYVQMPGPFPMGKFPSAGKTREEILGEPLKKWEIMELVKPLISDNRQVNLGRDGVTHNMLNLVHTHWKRRRVCKVRCKGIPTVDMDNVCRVLEEKTGGKIIYRVGGVAYLFRGRNYNYRTCPQYPLMLWKPAAPVYPKLIQEAPEGLTKSEADELRKKGKELLPICKLSKNGVYVTLVRNIRSAFEESVLVKLDCKGMHASDYKKLGAKLKDLVPCVLLSFDDEQILVWRGQNWKSMYPKLSALPPNVAAIFDASGQSERVCAETSRNGFSSSCKIMSLWKSAVDSSKAVLLEDTDLDPDSLLGKVEEFEGISQVAEHSYEAILSAEDEISSDRPTIESGFSSGISDGDVLYEEEGYENEIFDIRPVARHMSLPIDRITEKLRQEHFKLQKRNDFV